MTQSLFYIWVDLGRETAKPVNLPHFVFQNTKTSHERVRTTTQLLQELDWTLNWRMAELLIKRNTQIGQKARM